MPSRCPKGEVKVDECRNSGSTAAIAPPFRVGLVTEPKNWGKDFRRGVHSDLRLAGRTTPARFEMAL